jgi:hypothetical protein
MGDTLPEGVGPRGHRGRPQLRAHVRHPHAESEDRPPGRPRPGRPGTKIADRGYVIVDGKIEFEGRSTQELWENELVTKYYLVV